MSANQKFGSGNMSAVIVAAVKAAWPDNRAKHVARALGCSVSAGKRIASLGRVPVSKRDQLLTVLERLLAANEQRIRQYRRELRIRDADLAHQNLDLASHDGRPSVAVADRSAAPSGKSILS